MAYRLIWAPAARFDIENLGAYIAQDNPTAARRFLRSVFHVIERLSEFPESGRIVPELNDRDIREIVRRPCRIVYRIKRDQERIEIVRVWHSARGIPKVS